MTLQEWRIEQARDVVIRTGLEYIDAEIAFLKAKKKSDRAIDKFEKLAMSAG